MNTGLLEGEVMAGEGENELDHNIWVRGQNAAGM